MCCEHVTEVQLALRPLSIPFLISTSSSAASTASTAELLFHKAFQGYSTCLYLSLMAWWYFYLWLSLCERRNKKAWKETLAGKGVVSDSQVSMLWDRVVLGCFVRYRCSAKSVSLPICSLSCHTHRASQIQKHKNIFLSKNKQAALWPKHQL